jgi:hypothetical protein
MKSLQNKQEPHKQLKPSLPKSIKGFLRWWNGDELGVAVLLAVLGLTGFFILFSSLHEWRMGSSRFRRCYKNTWRTHDHCETLAGFSLGAGFALLA